MSIVIKPGVQKPSYTSRTFMQVRLTLRYFISVSSAVMLETPLLPILLSFSFLSDRALDLVDKDVKLSIKHLSLPKSNQSNIAAYKDEYQNASSEDATFPSSTFSLFVH